EVSFRQVRCQDVVLTEGQPRVDVGPLDRFSIERRYVETALTRQQPEMASTRPEVQCLAWACRHVGRGPGEFDITVAEKINGAGSAGVYELPFDAPKNAISGVRQIERNSKLDLHHERVSIRNSHGIFRTPAHSSRGCVMGSVPTMRFGTPFQR